MKYLLLILLGIGYLHHATAQRPDMVLPKEKRALAEQSIKDLKEGILVVRLQTNHRKIQALENTINSSQIKPNQKKRYEQILAVTLQKRDEFNVAISEMFIDSFGFCPVYVMYDTSTKVLQSGATNGIFINQQRELDSTITIPADVPIFMVNYRVKSGDFPFDVLVIRALEHKLDEPFPYYAPLRASWVNNINTPAARKAVVKLDNRLQRYYDRVMGLTSE